MINTNWGGVVEDNRFGTHEFLNSAVRSDVKPISTEIWEAVLYRRCRSGLNI